ncbi:hypothetical protein NPIL_527801 [Nephila pilipes]|uniref:Uncharacterized protein n=1 Tax=Nephila pilipes TaxID=299642 RepID=A0A8X6TX36_NEPPI|nr:hypothetical protein NPIL_527801 [Nephila pilipes]
MLKGGHRPAVLVRKSVNRFSSVGCDVSNGTSDGVSPGCLKKESSFDCNGWGWPGRGDGMRRFGIISELGMVGRVLAPG